MKKYFWEGIGYITLIGLIVGQIIVGYWYLPAQILYLICNTACTVRTFALNQPPADKIKNCVFTAITIGLIIIWVIRGGA